MYGMGPGYDIGLFRNYIGKKFLIRCRQDDKFAIDTCQNQNSGGNIIIWQGSASNTNQIWTVDAEGHLINVANPHAWIYATGVADKSALAISGMAEGGAYAHGNRARWCLTPQEEIVCLENPNQMFNVAGGKMTNKADMILWHRQGPNSKNDKWRIDVVGDVNLVFGVQAMGDLMYHIGTRFFIRCLADPNLVVDSASKQRSGGGDTLLWSDTHNANPNQLWTLDPFGHIVNFENQSMALVPASVTEKAPVTVCPLAAVAADPRSRWTMNPYGEICTQADPNLLLNVCGGQLKNGPALILWRRQGAAAKNDKWRIDRA